MTHDTKENGLREQAVKSLDEIAIRDINENISQRQPLRGISAYECLRAEWLVCNPIHSEAELLAACVVFARACGFILREKMLEAHRREIEGGDYGRN